MLYIQNPLCLNIESYVLLTYIPHNLIIMPYTLNPKWNNKIALSHIMPKTTLIYFWNTLSLNLNDRP
jgi:hypothetical protein